MYGSPQGSYRMSQVDIRQERVRAEFIDPEIFVQKVERIGDRHLQANQANQTHGHQYALSGRHSFENHFVHFTAVKLDHLSLPDTPQRGKR